MSGSVLLTLLCSIAISGTPFASAAEFELPLGGQASLHPLLARVGSFDEAALRQDGHGVRLATSGEGEEEAGFRPRFPIAGDFEMEIDYALGDIRPAAEGFGSGLKIWGKTQDGKAFTLGHLKQPNGKNANAWVVVTNEGKGSPAIVQTPTATTKGTLRIVRSGDVFSFSTIDSAGAHELGAVPLSAARIDIVKTIVTTHDKPGMAVATVSRIRIAGDLLPPEANLVSSKSATGWVWILGGSVVGAGAIAGIAFLSWKLRWFGGR